MKKTLFATTATAALAMGGMASAQGISLFGEARLGLGYNINNEGGVTLQEEETEVIDGEEVVTELGGEDNLRAVSRVRFGVNMTGETDSGITFGATIRADNAIGGEGDAPLSGQTEGNVFVSGNFGTLTFGDTNAADEQWVGDIPGNLSLTGLGDLHETLFISNGGNLGNDSGNDFAANPEARPTVRYDFDIAGFGISLSSNRDLTDIGVGAGYAADFGGGSWSVGLGYYDFDEFSSLPLDIDEPRIPGQERLIDVPSGTQWSASINGEYEAFGFGIVYTNADGDSLDGDDDIIDDEDTAFETLGVGGTFGWDAFTVGAYYVQILAGEGELSNRDGESTWGLTGAYDLGGGAQIAGGVGQSFGRDDLGEPGEPGFRPGFDSQYIADFGIKMAF